MAVTSTSTSVTYAGNGSTTVFPVPFKFYSVLDLYVTSTVNSTGVVTQLHYGTDFSATGAAQDGGGSLTLNTAPASGVTLSISLAMALTQPTTLQSQGSFPPKTITDMADRLTLGLQQVDAARADLATKEAADLVNVLAAIAALNGASHSVSDVSSVLAFGTSTARTLTSRFTDNITVYDYGATGNGTTDDTTALTSANSVGALHFPPGTYKITGNITFAGRVRMSKGAVLNIPNAVTVTFNGGFEAGVHQVFNCTGTGAVVFNRNFIHQGYPEWWGAVTGGPDCLAALNAATIALPVIQLQAGDYFISNTWNISTSHVAVRGVGEHWQGAGNGTRIIVQSATADAILVGTAANPGGGPNSFLWGTLLEYLTVTRDRAVTPPSPGNEFNGAAGIRNKFTTYTYFNHITSAEHTHGFVMYGTVQTNLIGCFAFRSLAGNSATNDLFWGFYQENSASIGLAGGNGSTRYFDCTASLGWTPATTVLSDSIGFNVNTGWVDTYFFRPETSNTQKGMQLTAVSGSNGNVDLKIINPVFDQFGDRGLLVLGNGVSQYQSLQVAFGWFGPANVTGAMACIHLYQCSGGIKLIGNELDCSFNTVGSGTQGLLVDSSFGFTSENKIIGSRRPLVVNTSSNFKILDIVNNPVETATQAAALLTGCGRFFVAPVVMGGSAGRFLNGVALASTANHDGEINCSTIDPACLTSGAAAQKVQINGVNITTTGLSGSVLISGVMT